jgi:hypothetical protein
MVQISAKHAANPPAAMDSSKVKSACFDILYLLQGGLDVVKFNMLLLGWGLGFGVWGLGFGVWGLGFGV